MARPDSGERVAVVAHVHYPEIWKSLLHALGRLTMGHDLYVTVTPKGESARDAILAARPDANIVAVANKGRDWAPFLHVLPTVLGNGTGVVLKVHTKRSVHLGPRGHQWRERILHNLIPLDQGPIMAAFDDGAGLIGPRGEYRRINTWQAERVFDTAHVELIAARLGVQRLAADAGFFGGSMFWIHADVLRRLQALGMPRFEEEAGQLDGSMAHILERLITPAAEASGRTVAEVGPRIIRRPRARTKSWVSSFTRGMVPTSVRR